jgi:hypothetical protein
MEDICYFLSIKAMGSKEKVKWVSRHPCNKPSEVVAFRTSLAKYLETLRQDSLKSRKPEEKTNAKDKGAVGSPSIAWWWKDVVVRRSLLEECTGERLVADSDAVSAS